MKRVMMILILAGLLAAAVIHFFPHSIERILGRITAQPAATPPPAKPVPDPETNEMLKVSLAAWREKLALRYAAATTESERRVILDDARLVLESTLPAMMRTWLGTPWDFNGVAASPGDGKIACGYFVSTVLRDAGFHVHRYRLAQQPSENILRTFLPRASCRLSAGVDYDVFSEGLESSEPGIYLVGLDTHVGFIVVSDGGFRFIHSSGSRPWSVVDESRADAHVLRVSNWRMLGNLTSDREVVRKWLTGVTFSVHGS
ncbi:MAG: hypothetical protein ACNA8L_10550 [Luteolibacter sp.]